MPVIHIKSKKPITQAVDGNRLYAYLTAYSPYGLPLADWQGDDERYLYSGKELDRDGGLWLYDFHARQYDPQLGRFTTPDPLQEKYLPLSPYLYCAANPISLIDPSGMYMEGNSLKIAQQHVKNLQLTISNLIKQNKENPVDHFNERIEELTKSIADINDAIADENREYIINLVESDKEYVQNGTSLKGENEKGDMSYSVTVEENMGCMSHEFKHLGQIARNELNFYDKGNSNHNINHEVEAYKAEWSVTGSLHYMPEINQISIQDFQHLQRNGGDYTIFLQTITRSKDITPDNIRKFCDFLGKPIYNGLK